MPLGCEGLLEDSFNSKFVSLLFTVTLQDPSGFAIERGTGDNGYTKAF